MVVSRVDMRERFSGVDEGDGWGKSKVGVGGSVSGIVGMVSACKRESEGDERRHRRISTCEILS